MGKKCPINLVLYMIPNASTQHIEIKMGIDYPNIWSYFALAFWV